MKGKTKLSAILVIAMLLLLALPVTADALSLQANFNGSGTSNSGEYAVEVSGSVWGDFGEGITSLAGQDIPDHVSATVVTDNQRTGETRTMTESTFNSVVITVSGGEIHEVTINGRAQTPQGVYDTYSITIQVGGIVYNGPKAKEAYIVNGLGSHVRCFDQSTDESYWELEANNSNCSPLIINGDKASFTVNAEGGTFTFNLDIVDYQYFPEHKVAQYTMDFKTINGVNVDQPYQVQFNAHEGVHRGGFDPYFYAPDMWWTGKAVQATIDGVQYSFFIELYYEQIFWQDGRQSCEFLFGLSFMSDNDIYSINATAKVTGQYNDGVHSLTGDRILDELDMVMNAYPYSGGSVESLDQRCIDSVYITVSGGKIISIQLNGSIQLSNNPADSFSILHYIDHS